MAWNIKQIKENMKYLIKRYKSTKNPLVGLSLNANFEMINSYSGNVKLYNFLDKITGSRFSLVKDSKYEKMMTNISNDNPNFMDSNYFKFLLDISSHFNDLLSNIELQEINYNHIELSDEDMINLSKEFYLSLGNREVYEIACKVLDSRDTFDISNIRSNSYKDAGGLTFCDYIFNKAYIQITKSNNIFDLLALNHEVMHAIDFYIKGKPLTKNYYGFHEIPTYTIDLLFCDFLEQKGFDKTEIDKIEINRYCWLMNIANDVDMQIKHSLFSKYRFQSTKATIEMKQQVCHFGSLKNLLELESGVIAYGLYKQIQENKEYGINNLISLMKTILPLDKKPDFSFIGLDDYEINELCNEYLKQFNNSKTK